MDWPRKKLEIHPQDKRRVFKYEEHQSIVLRFLESDPVRKAND
jgi:hypothetical protein